MTKPNVLDRSMVGSGGAKAQAAPAPELDVRKLTVNCGSMRTKNLSNTTIGCRCIL